MAENPNKFDLNKTSDKKFDLGKGRERKFDLSKDDEELDVQNLNTADSTSHSNEPEPKKKWLYIVGALVIIALLIWGLSKCSNGEQDVIPVENETVEGEAIDTVMSVETPVAEDAGDVIEELDSDSSTEPETEVQMPSSGQEVVSNTDDSSDVSITSEPVAENMSLNDNVESVSSNIEQKALSVIRGEFGDGLTRRNNLGAEYDEIQKRVNEMYRQGLVY